MHFYLEEDMTPTTRSHRSKLKRIAAAARDDEMEVKLSGNRINIDGTMYGINDLDTIPSNLSAKIKQEKVVNGGLAYRGHESIFSNFYMQPFEVEGFVYNSVEQYYQYTKAISHSKYSRAEKILKCTDPRRIKELGDGIQDKQGWLAIRVQTLYTGTIAKFEQNPDLAIALVSTGMQQLCEATTDMFFGCGVGLQSAKWSKMDCPGENVAGRIVMKARGVLSGMNSSMMDTGLQSDISEIAGSPAPLNESHLTASQTADDPTANNTQPPPSCSSPSSTTQSMETGLNTSLEIQTGQKKKYTRKRNRGRGRGRGTGAPPKPSNITDRSARRQSAQKSQLSDKDLEFLGRHNQKNQSQSTRVENNTSTPISENPGSKHLSNSELNAMGIDPGSQYAADVKRKYQMSRA